MFYIPREEIRVDLEPVPGKTSHCPLKGDASYYMLPGMEFAEGDYFAWSYDAPLEFAESLKGLVAFNANKVCVEEIGG